MTRHIEITTYIPCPVRCSYCPQDKLIEAYKGINVLSFEKFTKALDNIPEDVQIHFSAFSEPFLNKQTYNMIKYARILGYPIVVYTTTRGLDVDRLKDIPFTEFNIHDIGNCQSVPYATRIDRITDPVSRAGNLWEREPKKQPLICSRSRTFEQNVMLPNGDVYLCCMDWSLKHKIGSIFETNFDNLNRQKEYDLCRYCEKALNKKN